jgi:hypothetical protein
MSAAISVADPEVKEFLKAGVPAPKIAQPQAEEKADEVPEARKQQPAAVDAPPEKPRTKAKPAAVLEERQEAAVPVTFRLPERLVRAMISASADRKIKRIKPSTQQDMAALAMEEWLRKNAYL